MALMMGSLLTACDEVEEATKYDNWRERNEHFTDSLQALAGETYVATVEQADQIEVNKLFAIIVPAASTNEKTEYIYCKKLRAVPEGRRPLYTESVRPSTTVPSSTATALMATSPDTPPSIPRRWIRKSGNLWIPIHQRSLVYHRSFRVGLPPCS